MNTELLLCKAKTKTGVEVEGYVFQDSFSNLNL